MFDPAKFTMPKTHPHKEAIMPMMRFSGEFVGITLRPHENGRLKVMREGAWIGTIVPRELEDGSEGHSYEEEYMLLSHPDSDHEYRGTAGDMARIVSMLQQRGGDWDKVADGYYPFAG
jgi:hypothetical protein